MPPLSVQSSPSLTRIDLRGNNKEKKRRTYSLQVTNPYPLHLPLPTPYTTLSGNAAAAVPEARTTILSYQRFHRRSGTMRANVS